MTDPTRSDRPADDLENRLGRFFRAEVERARTDLGRRPLRDRPATIARFAAPVVPVAAAVVILIAALLLRWPVAGGRPGAPSPAGHTSGAASPDVSPPRPVADDWSLITWSRAAPEAFGGPGNQFISDVAAWFEGFVAIGYECCGTPRRGVVWSSLDGRVWERIPDATGVFAGAELEAIEPAGDQLVMAGRLGESAAIWLSDDGHRWRLGASGEPFEGRYLGGIASGPAGLLAYGWHSDGGVVWSSQNGRSWERDEATFRDAGPNGPTIVGTTWGYAATSEAGAWWSVDGRSWMPATVEGDGRLGGVTVGPDGLLAAGQTGPPPPEGSLGGPIRMPEYWHSVDGRDWRKTQPFGGESAAGVNALMSDGSRIVALRQTREILTSRDGLSWRRLAVAADESVELANEPLSFFSRTAVGTFGIVGADHAPDDGTEEDADAAVWFGAASSGRLPTAVETLPPLYNDGRNDARCIGGAGGDPGVVCIQIGYYLRNESSRDRLVRLTGALEAVLTVPHGAVGRLTDIGPVWDSGKPLVVELLSPGCQPVQRLEPTGDLALVVIAADGQVRVESPPPPEPLSETPFDASEACGG